MGWRIDKFFQENYVSEWWATESFANSVATVVPILAIAITFAIVCLKNSNKTDKEVIENRNFILILSIASVFTNTIGGILGIIAYSKIKAVMEVVEKTS